MSREVWTDNVSQLINKSGSFFKNCLERGNKLLGILHTEAHGRLDLDHVVMDTIYTNDNVMVH